jgi:xylulokinase
MLSIDCGIDIGSTNLKIVFVDESGRVILTRSVPTPRIFDEFGPLTNPLDLISTLETMIISGWRDIGSPMPLRSIAAAGVGEDGICVNAKCEPQGNAIPWFDKRSSAEASEFQKYRYLVPKTGIDIDETRTASKWLWLNRYRPIEINRAMQWVTLTDFPAVWWSGKTFISASLAPRTGCFNIRNRAWVSELLDAAQAPTLPQIKQAGEIIGGVQDGPLRKSGVASTNTILVAGGHDHPVAATMIRRLDPDGRVDSMGTANLIYGETDDFDNSTLTKDLAFSVPPAGHSISCLGVLELSAELNSLLNVFELRTFLAQDHLAGAPPKSYKELQASLTDNELVVRRRLELMSLKARRLLTSMDKAGIPAGQIYTTGGWSRSESFVELRASIFGQKIMALGELQLTATGAALFGAQAASGKSQCPIEKSDIKIISPMTEWVEQYQHIFNSIDRNSIEPPGGIG